MNVVVPAQYHELNSFREYFETGVPVLTYHKVGVRPFGVRLKGLYTSPKRFVQQVRELKDAGFTAVTLDQVFSAPDKKVVITFDDGFRNVFENTMAVLQEAQFCATQFLVANFIGKVNEWDLRDGEVSEPLMDDAQIREWLAAGHKIGAHCLNHPRLTRLTLRDAREEIFASKKKLEDMFGQKIEHFCYPYGDCNDAVRDLVMEAGYKTACTTVHGINTPETHPFSLHRIAVRYPSRSLKTLKARLFGQS